MTRGKYAAKAAGQRAAAAAETVETLKAQLVEQRAEAAREIAGLKTENQRLAGKLTSSVDALARSAIASARQDAQDEVRREREASRERAYAALKVIRDYVQSLPSRAWPQLYDALGVSADEVYAAGADDLDANAVRRVRRLRQRDFRANGNDMEAFYNKDLLGAKIARKLSAGED